MTVSASSLAYGGVIAVVVVLFAIGTPAQRAQNAAADAPPPAAAKPAEPAVTTASAAGVTLRSVSFEFPSSDRAFPGGASAELIGASCAACHSSGMVLNQPSLTKADWEGEVTKMRTVYKAPVDAADVPAIVAYLVANKGLK